MASYSLHSYFVSESSQAASIYRRGAAEQEISPIGDTSSSFSSSDLTSGFAQGSDRVVLDEPTIVNKVESPTSSKNVEKVNEVNPPDGD